MRRLCLFASAAAALACSPVQAQRPASGITFVGLDGTCQKLATPGGDLAKSCSGKLLNLVYPTGRSQLSVFIEAKSALTFGGVDHPAEGDVARLTIDYVLAITVEGDETKQVKIDATGECTYTNPNVGPVHVNCTADTANGRYELQFISDGKPPLITNS